MKANELRIGNFIWDRHGKHVTVVDTISVHPQDSEMVLISTVSAYPPKVLDLNEPIPLTKEWLIKLGFIPNNYNCEFTLKYLTLDCEYTDKNEWNIRYEDYPLSTDIKYVHQLQNLYFALTGEELQYEKRNM